jgi:hypothetical protein
MRTGRHNRGRQWPKDKESKKAKKLAKKADKGTKKEKKKSNIEPDSQIAFRKGPFRHYTFKRNRLQYAGKGVGCCDDLRNFSGRRLERCPRHVCLCPKSGAKADRQITTRSVTELIPTHWTETLGASVHSL